MFKRLFGRKKSEQTPEIRNPEIRMPKVDVLPDIEEIFDEARKAAAGEGELVPDASERHVLIVTPGRMFMF